MRTLHNPRVTILSRAGLILAATLVAAACAPAGAPSAPGPSAAATTAGQTCAKGALPTVAAGTLTVGTDQPVYQPWYVDDKPENGQGFESAVAYAIADQLGYPKDKVAWTRVPFNAAIKPTTPAAVFNTNDDAKLALSNGQVDAIVVDLPTAFFITSAEFQNAKIVGQLPTTGAPEQFGAVLDKGSPLTGCVSEAVEALRSAGTLTALEQQWLTAAGSAPELT